MRKIIIQIGEKNGFRNLQEKLKKEKKKKGAYCALESTLSFYVSYENCHIIFLLFSENKDNRFKICALKHFLNSSDLLWDKIVLVIEKNFRNSRGKAENFENFEIIGTIYSNSESSGHFLVTECFFNLFLEVSQIWWIRTIKIQIGKNYWDLETCRKS